MILKLKRSLILRKSVFIDGRKTSISLEDAFWKAMKEIAANQQITLQDLVTQIDSDRRHEKHLNLSSVIRLFVLDYYQHLTELRRLGQ